MPGFIDRHKHLNDGPQTEARGAVAARSRLHDDAGQRRQAEKNVALLDKIDRAKKTGRASFRPVPWACDRRPPRRARAVQALAAEGIKNTGEIGLTPEPAPPQAEIEVLKAIVDEAKKVGVQVNVQP